LEELLVHKVIEFTWIEGNGQGRYVCSTKQTLFFALMASYFFCLPQKSNQKEGTQPSRPAAPLRCSTKWASIEARPSGLHKTQATAELEQPMADYSHFVSATQRDGMGFFSFK
jgi:hypothetical protein